MRQISVFFLTTLFFLISLQATAQKGYTVKDFKISVAGTSSLHDWESAVTKADANSRLELDGQQLKAINSLKVTIPAKGIVSTKGRIMDGKTYEALKADAHPNITFTLTTAKLSGLNVSAKGKLALAGVTKDINLKATGQITPAGHITFKGSYSLLMTDYGMSPPTALMGSIKTGDEVTVHYSLTLAPGN